MLQAILYGRGILPKEQDMKDIRSLRHLVSEGLVTGIILCIPVCRVMSSAMGWQGLRKDPLHIRV